MTPRNHGNGVRAARMSTRDATVVNRNQVWGSLEADTPHQLHTRKSHTPNVHTNLKAIIVEVPFVF